jgi:hypothetical protein
MDAPDFFKALVDVASSRHHAALIVAHHYGTIDGDHHKAWVIDQMVRALCGTELYAEWVKAHPDWDEGIAP